MTSLNVGKRKNKVFAAGRKDEEPQIEISEFIDTKTGKNDNSAHKDVVISSNEAGQTDKAINDSSTKETSPIKKVDDLPTDNTGGNDSESVKGGSDQTKGIENNPHSKPSDKPQPDNGPSDNQQSRKPSDKSQPDNGPSDNQQSSEPSDNSQPDNAPSDNQQSNEDPTGYEGSKFSKPGDEQDREISEEMKNGKLNEKKKKKKKKRDKYDGPPANTVIHHYYGHAETVNIGNDNINYYGGKEEPKIEKDEELVSTEPRDSSPPAEHVSQNNSSEYNYVQPSQSCEIKSGLNPNIKSSSEVQTTSSKVCVRVKARKRDISNIHDESTAAASLTGFTKEEINFTKMGMIALNILADVLYDLLKPDKQNLQPRCDCDITYLYSEHRNLNKHIPSNSWGGQWQRIQTTDIAIGDDIERIRLTRNELQHSRMFQLDDTRFDELCNILSDLLKRFDNYNKPTRLYTNQLNDTLAKTITVEEVKSIVNEIHVSGMDLEFEMEHQINVPTQ